MTASVAALITPGIALSGRIPAETLKRLAGIVSLIAGPMQTAYADFLGGARITRLIGADFTATKGALRGWRLGIESGILIVRFLPVCKCRPISR